ncbi:hypothetical protein BV20DRAFT_813832 [Pilatotrama ljubarskyi]|nr:hypothetical protein BV20DRAFT_813832 [Pilatotrama ljubarskyi]
MQRPVADAAVVLTLVAVRYIYLVALVLMQLCNKDGSVEGFPFISGVLGRTGSLKMLVKWFCSEACTVYDGFNVARS